MYRFRFMNTEVDNVTMNEAVDEVIRLASGCVKEKPNAFVVTPNVNHIVKLEKDKEFQEAYKNAALVLADGMPLIWFSKWYKTPIKEKVSGSDLFPLVCEEAAKKGLKMFFLGCGEGVGQKAADNLKAKYPGLQVVGTYSPPMYFENSPEEVNKVIEIIHEAKPDIMVMGLSAPRQEKFINKYRHQLNIPVSLCLGASIDFEAGTKKRCPKWMSQHGLEWLYRFNEEPVRLFRRYFIENFRVFPLVLKYKNVAREVREHDPRFMRVLLVSNMYPDKKFPSWGLFVKRFADELDELKINYKKAVMHKPTGKLDKAFKYFCFYTKTFFASASRKYDVIYVHYVSHSSPAILLGNKIRPKRIIANVHGDDVLPVTDVQKKMVKYADELMKVSDKVVSPSKHFAKIITDNFEIPEEKVVVYPSCGVDEKLFSFCENPARDEGDKDKPGPIFGMAGRIDYDKGWDLFIRAVRFSVDEELKAQYVVVGSGGMEQEFYDMREEYRLKGTIARKPMMTEEELADFFHKIDFFVFPSMRDESLGLTPLEAMSTGLPVIASDIAVVHEYVDESNGIIFTKGDAEELSKALFKANEIYSDKEKYMKYREASRAKAALYHRSKIRETLKEILYV